MTPRESVLLRGQSDWVALDRIHWDVSEAMPKAPRAAVQEATLELIRELVEQGLFEIGDVTSGRGFQAWDQPLDEAIQRLRRVYVDQFEDQSVWPWYCWLNLTDKGEQVAQNLDIGSTTT